MIDVYTWPTPNGHKVHIMLEEIGLPYAVHPVNIRSGEQFDQAFLAISPNNKIPAIARARRRACRRAAGSAGSTSRAPRGGIPACR